MSTSIKKTFIISTSKSGKILCMVVFFICFIPVLMWGQIAGDSNNDYLVNIVDALFIAQYTVNLTPSNFYVENCDVDLDGSVTIIDALFIAQLTVGLRLILPSAAIVKDITPVQAKTMKDNGAQIFFLDVRSIEEFNDGHIEVAENMDWQNGYLNNHHLELPSIPIIVYCQSGNRSGSASQFLSENNHANVLNMLGGYTEWIKLEPADPVGNYVWIEAENGEVYAPQILKSDSYADYSPNDTASGEIYFEVGAGNNALDYVPGNGHMIYNFAIPNNQVYRVWARVKTPSTSDDSFWIRMDSGSWTKWDNIGIFYEWGWAVAGEYSLSAGSHTFTLAYCEDGAKFDKLLITDVMAFTPQGLGESGPVSGEINYFHTPNVVDRHGNLKVIGSRLCNESGNPIQLRGVNTHGPQWYPVAINQTIPNLAESWGITIVRLAMYVEDFKNGDFWNGYLAHKEKIKAVICQMADDAIDAGIYVIIDWHIHNNPANFTGDAIDFFAEMSSRYGMYPNVLFEICNEPEYTDWSVIKNYANQLIPVIRQNDPDDKDNIIIVGTPSWSQEVHIAANDPLTGYNNIMYALHFYAASHQQSYRDNAQNALNRGLPIIATEWSPCDYDVSYNDFNEGQNWLNWLNSNSISWINWSFCNRDDASAILKPGVSIAGPWADRELTATGTWIKARITE